MDIIFDQDKRDKTLEQRGLDFSRAAEIFSGRHFTIEDSRLSYSEPRFITVGKLNKRMVVLVWTPRGDKKRIISMRKANEREQTKYFHRLE